MTAEMIAQGKTAHELRVERREAKVAERVAHKKEVDEARYAEIKDEPLVGKRRRVTLPQWAVAWIVLIPALIFLVLFMFYPIINAFFMAFINDFEFVEGAGSFALGSFFKALETPCINWSFIDPTKCSTWRTMPSFGFNNFIYLFQDAHFPSTILNTAILVVVEVPLTILVSLVIASFLNNIKALKGLYQTIFFLPYVTNAIALGLVFNMLFSHTPGGIINVIITACGGQPINFLYPNTYKYITETQEIILPAASKFNQAIVIVTSSVWNGIAFKILVFMSGLATIDKQYYDAAKIDGSSGFTIWRRITLPLLSPQILYITITSFIGAFKMYTGVMSVYSNINGSGFYFGGTDGYAWMPVVGWIYKQMDPSSGNLSKPGIAAAGSLVLLAIIMLITVAQFAVSKKRVHY